MSQAYAPRSGSSPPMLSMGAVIRGSTITLVIWFGQALTLPVLAQPDPPIPSDPQPSQGSLFPADSQTPEVLPINPGNPEPTPSDLGAPPPLNLDLGFELIPSIPSPSPLYTPPPLPPLFPTNSTPPPADLASPKPAAIPVARIVGQVVNELGEPVVGAQVRIIAEHSEVNPDLNPPDDGGVIPELADPTSAPESVAADPVYETVETDPQGGFELIYPQSGLWSLVIWHPDYERLETSIWIQAGLTTPMDVVLKAPIVSQPRTRLGILGVGGLQHTQALAQRLTQESVRLGLIPPGETIVPIDNRKIYPILERIGLPLYEVFERDRLKPEAVQAFFDYMGLQAIVITRVDVLTRPASAAEVQLQSRSRFELWTLNEQGQPIVRTLAEASRSETEASDLNSTETSQLYQIQVTDMATEVGDRWQSSHPLASYLDAAQTPLQPQESRLDTTVKLQIPQSVPPPPANTPDPDLSPVPSEPESPSDDPSTSQP